jgi:hypothetical protein
MTPAVVVTRRCLMWQFTLDRDCKAGDLLYVANRDKDFFLEAKAGRMPVAALDADYPAGSVISVLIRPDGALSLASADPHALR